VVVSMAIARADSGAKLGPHGPATAQAGDLLLVPRAVEEVAMLLWPRVFGVTRPLLGGSIEEALGQVRLGGNRAGKANDVDGAAVQCVVHAPPGAESARQHDRNRHFLGELLGEFEEVGIRSARVDSRCGAPATMAVLS